MDPSHTLGISAAGNEYLVLQILKSPSTTLDHFFSFLFFGCGGVMRCNECLSGCELKRTFALSLLVSTDVAVYNIVTDVEGRSYKVVHTILEMYTYE